MLFSLLFPAVNYELINTWPPELWDPLYLKEHRPKRVATAITDQILIASHVLCLYEYQIPNISVIDSSDRIKLEILTDLEIIDYFYDIKFYKLQLGLFMFRHHDLPLLFINCFYWKCCCTTCIMRDVGVLIGLRFVGLIPDNLQL